MPEFNMGNLDDWIQVCPGEMVDFTVPEDGFRHVRFDVLSDGHCSVRVVTPDNWWIVAAGFGRLGVRFGMDRNFAVAVEAEKDTAIFLRTGRAVQLIPESITPTHTTVEPRGAHVNAELRRMMHIVRLNSERREAMLRAEIARLAQGVQVAAPAAPAAAPAAPAAAAAAPAAPAVPEGAAD